VQMTSGRHQGSLGSILEIFAAPIRQIFAGIDAPAIGTPVIRVFTQPGSQPVSPLRLVCLLSP
jgi:hypothetical protein